MNKAAEEYLPLCLRRIATLRPRCSTLVQQAMHQPLGPGRKCCQQCSVRLSNRRGHCRGHCHRTRGADRAAERAPHAEQANRLLLLRLTAEDAAVGDGASEAPGEHVFGSDHHGELLYGCGLGDKGCTTALLCQREVPCVVGEPTLQRAVHKHEGVIICRLVVGEYMVQFVATRL